MSTVNSDSSESWMITAKQEITFDNFEQSQVFREKALNLVSYIPVVSTFGGIVRMFMGIVQLVQFTAATIFVTLSDLFSKQPLGFGHRSIKHMFYSFHAIENIIRGFCETNFGTLGNIFFLLYDQVFHARTKYVIEYKPGYTDPYIRAWECLKSPQPLDSSQPTRITKRPAHI